MKLATLFTGGALLLAIVGGCTAETKAKSDKLCTPGAYIFCRCQDRQEGAKLCNETGDGFGKCEPCETDTNPEIDYGGTSSSGSSSGDNPFPEEDGGPQGDGSTGSVKCGDGIVQAGEDCDDKNTNDDDGCSTSCKLSGLNPAATNTCPGLEVHVWGGSHKPTTTGSTNTSGNRGVTPNCTATNYPTTGAALPDRVFKVVAHKTGTMKVTTTDATFDSFLYVVADGKCSGTTVTQFACKNDVQGNGGETLQFPVDAGKQYHVFVDAYGIDNTNKGNFRVTFEIP